MFDRVGSAGAGQFTAGRPVAILLVTVVQSHRPADTMGINGSARNATSARYFVAGTNLQRIITIAWCNTTTSQAKERSGNHCLRKGPEEPRFRDGGAITRGSITTHYRRARRL